MSLRIGSLCSGFGGLEMAVQSAFGGQTVFHADPDPGASKILAHHWPETPNLGDITAADWRQALALHGPVDAATMGFPCTAAPPRRLDRHQRRRLRARHPPLGAGDRSARTRTHRTRNQAQQTPQPGLQ